MAAVGTQGFAGAGSFAQSKAVVEGYRCDASQTAGRRARDRSRRYARPTGGSPWTPSGYWSVFVNNSTCAITWLVKPLRVACGDGLAATLD
jgi:hypothetical protein